MSPPIWLSPPRNELSVHELGAIASEVPHDRLSVPAPAGDNQLAGRCNHELGAIASEVPHDRLIVSAPTGQVDDVVSDHELGAIASEVPHDRLKAPTSPPDAGSAPLFPESHERGLSSKVPHDRLTFWLTDEQVAEEKKHRKPWYSLGGYPTLYDTSGIDIKKYGTRDDLIDIFLQSTFFRERSNKKFSAERLRKKWASFVDDIEHRIDSLNRDRQEYEESTSGFNFKLHNMCLQERVPCAAVGNCVLCAPSSRKFVKKNLFSSEFSKLSSTLRKMILSANNQTEILVREVVAESERSAKSDKKGYQVLLLEERIDLIDNRLQNVEETSTNIGGLASEVADLQEKWEHEQHDNRLEWTEDMEEAVDKRALDAFDDRMYEEVHRAAKVSINRLSSAAIKRMSSASEELFKKARQDTMKTLQETAFQEMKNEMLAQQAVANKRMLDAVLDQQAVANKKMIAEVKSMVVKILRNEQTMRRSKRLASRY